ncbi:16S rRNA (cytidine(1402)-2'-O)-methyltransferase [Pectinatus brassicae]|uniref:Ribosomal RNA small subunit methyltransferase I n=1 Tax=Pectinatus brassicae TaxID=862415 RepID=A0A840UD23_9FIRM|nr:16S rRNA (cytidine(1402)-2'-O)-methyltransferase [Pectinatus brassicae]MBB5334909.1 16S rRNA (cytidine1402-2'-O)-methyltransferase [Pectinatus brassicae]
MLKKEKGTLYLVATPIGNLDDMTFRAVKILQEVDLIAAEDTRHTRKLLTHFDIHVSLTSYHEHNKLLKGPELLAKLLDGINIAVVSDAGLPGIADPGSHIAELAIENSIQVVPVPGANAALTALIASGLDTVRFSFIGFLPKKKNNRQELLQRLKNNTETLIFYETPHRLKKILKELEQGLGEKRQIAVCRELTKKFEQFIRGSIKEMNEYFAQNEPRGEFVLVIEGNNEAGLVEETVEIAPVAYVKQLMQDNISKKDAIKKAAKDLSMSRREIYNAVLKDEELNKSY